MKSRKRRYGRDLNRLVGIFEKIGQARIETIQTVIKCYSLEENTAHTFNLEGFLFAAKIAWNMLPEDFEKMAAILRRHSSKEFPEVCLLDLLKDALKTAEKKYLPVSDLKQPLVTSIVR